SLFPLFPPVRSVTPLTPACALTPTRARLYNQEDDRGRRNRPVNRSVQFVRVGLGFHPWRSLGVAALALAGLALPTARAQAGPSDGIFVSVHNPITSEVTSRVKEITTRAVQRFEAERGAGGQAPRTYCIVFDFNPGSRNAEAPPAGTRDFGPCQDLAEHVLRLQNVTTIAYLRGEVSRHT